MDTTISVSAFYGKKNVKEKYVAVLPPENTIVSDIGSSSSDDDIFEGDFSDLDPDFEPEDNGNVSTLPIDLPPVSDSEWDSDDNQPLIQVVQQSSRRTKTANYRWSKVDFHSTHFPVEAEFEPPNIMPTSLEYFQRFFDNALFEYISIQTNIYSTMTTGHSLNTTSSEMKAFIGIELLMGIVRMPSFEDYWGIATRYNIIADIMPIKRFKKIRRLLHFQDNTLDANGDRLFKIRPIIENIRDKCNRIEHEKLFSVDEMMIAYKGTKAGSLRQYLPNKPKKWGFKMFVRAGVSGIVYDFLMYTGSSTFDKISFSDTENSFGLGGKVVSYLCKSLTNPQESTVYFDNFFTSLELIEYLKKEYCISSLGTIRSNRLRGCILENDKSLLKSGRGSFDYRVDNTAGIAVVKWADKKCVTLASSYVSHNPVLEVKRYSKDDKKKISVQCPQIVKQYNIHMGGVDLADMLVSLYKTPYKSRRWYLGIFSQLVDISVNNAWLLYRRDMDALGNKKHTKLKNFRLDIARSLIQSCNVSRKRSSEAHDNQPLKKIRVTVAPRPTPDIRFDNIGHFPIFIEKGRCKFCTNGQTTILCQKCNLRLCIVTGSNSRNCFTLYHTKSI